MKLQTGMSVYTERIFTLEEVKTYCFYSKDINPIHYDCETSQKNGFENVHVPGLLVSSLFGGLMGSELPGFGTVHIHQEVSFIKPVYINELIKATITVEKIRYDKPIVTFSCIAEKKDGSIVIKGTGVVKVPEKYLIG